jgi:hypothetical protein
MDATFEVLKPYLEDFRNVISFLNSSNQRIVSYKIFCVALGDVLINLVWIWMLDETQPILC